MSRIVYWLSEPSMLELTRWQRAYIAACVVYVNVLALLKLIEMVRS